MTINRKYLLLAIIVFIVLIIGITIILVQRFSVNQNNNDIVSSPISTAISYAVSQPVIEVTNGRVVNSKFNYSYILPHGYLRTDLHFEDNGTLEMESSELIYLDIPRKVNYQIGGINIDVFSANQLVNNNLKDWIQSKSENQFTGEKLYVTKEIKSVKGDEIYILINHNPLLGKFKGPTLFVNSNGHIYTIAQTFDDDTYKVFKEVVSTLKIDDVLGDSELNFINDYLK